MRRRPAVTLMEVLIAMFIMAIGMLALLALFPVGAVSMAQALKDDRCAYASTMSESVAIANNVRYGDLNVVGPNGAFLNLNPVNGVPGSGLAFVDPYGALMMPTTPPFGLPLGAVPGTPATTGVIASIPRVYPTFAASFQLADRWFSLPDDISYTLSGTADTSTTGGSLIDRGRRYSYAYLLRQQPPPWNATAITMKSVQLYAVVYYGRPINSLSALTPYEWTYNATSIGLPLGTPIGVAGTNSITLPTGTTVKRGGWILDTSFNPAQPGQVNAYFYRVTNLADLGNTTTVEVQQTLLANVTQVTVMDFVAEVFDKGYGWQQ